MTDPADSAEGKGKRRSINVVAEIQDALEGSIVRNGNDAGFRPHAEAIYNRLRKLKVFKHMRGPRR